MNIPKLLLIEIYVRILNYSVINTFCKIKPILFSIKPSSFIYIQAEYK